MGFNDENARQLLADGELTPLVFDIETAPIPGASDYLAPVQAAKNLKDPEKIAADIEKRERDRDADLALDWNTNRIVALGYWSLHTDRDVVVFTARTEDQERELLRQFWRLAVYERPLVGFSIRHFDLPTLMQRSRYLGVPARSLPLRRGYSSHGDDIRDLFDILTFDDARATSCMSRSLKSFAKRFGIEVEDGELKGADVPLWLLGQQWDLIERHVIADVKTTVLLAQRIGVLVPSETGWLGVTK